ncbi:hypothetical protein AKJ43_00720 [candidate division MSBL1 archaeon SCGC-AAA261D19]|uniref:Cysteine-rich small domain-containing protein n=1 Tax=candidate division MSBL1 archaeon SCGC-AAA261D19 TaxID=1698273 RepID=A0A133V8I2_9EURY|nr:hypothetical protein AKJ43_00720 [candidate division MSBL1 archaeon SCGC-AAA261D19]
MNVHVEEAVKYGKILGPNKDCSYYPCHFDGQDCTWCFCPFFPCKDNVTGGRLTKGRLSGDLVWSCENCSWIHKPEVASFVLRKMLGVIGKSEPTHSQLLGIREEVLKAYPP